MEPSLGALEAIIADFLFWILPPEVIEQYGDYKDWQNVVGTGPLMLTDYVEGVSKTYAKNPDYWGYDPKYPDNRLPYVDELRALHIAEEATRLSALRSGKIDMIRLAGNEIKSIDVVRSLQRTDPEIAIWPFFQRADAFSLNIRNAPFDDIRVRHALQMALDLETINDTYYGGFAQWHPPRYLGAKGYYTEWEEWPEELKQYYTYDPEGAERLLDEAGYPRGADGVRFKFEHLHRDIADLGIIEIAAGYWDDIGVDVTIGTADWGTLTGYWSEQNYESIYGAMAREIPTPSMSAYGSEVPYQSEWMGGVENPDLAAAQAAFFAATSIDDQIMAAKQFGMALMTQHNNIGLPLAPSYQASQPWVKGFNGETRMGNFLFHTILARLWIDQDLKREMGF